MYIVIFFVLITLYFLLTLKVRAWDLLYTLGLKIDVPVYFLRYRTVYHLLQIIFFVLSLVSLFMIDRPYAYTLGIPILAIAWLTANNLGIKSGIKEYRRIMGESLNEATTHYQEFDENPEDDEFFKEAIETPKLSDKEIFQKYKEYSKYV